MATTVNVPDFTQYNFRIGDTAEAVEKQNGLTQALVTFGNSLQGVADSVTDDADRAESAAESVDPNKTVHTQGSGLPNEAKALAFVSDLASAPVGNAENFRQKTGTEFRDKGLGKYSQSIANFSSAVFGEGLQANLNTTSSTANDKVPFSWANLITVARSNERRAGIALNTFGSIPRAAIGINADGQGNPSNWVFSELWLKANTTVDSNGFIKSASPIFRLSNTAASAMGDGFTADGCGAYNEEARGVTAERIDIGHYMVTGCLGFSDSGWTIETPRGNNNEELLWVDAREQNDGSIIVKTYHRTHPNNPPFAQNNIDGYQNGDPIDIPERWIDLRLKMPAKQESSEQAE